MSDAHGSHAHDSQGHDAHGQDAHGAAGHGGGHGHDESPKQTRVAPWEPTPWTLIGIGVLVTGVVFGIGWQRKWNEAVKSHPGSTLPPAGASAKPG